MKNEPDGLELLFLAFLFGEVGESPLGDLNGSGGCGLLLLKRVKFVDGLGPNRRRAVIVTDSNLFLLRRRCLDLRQTVPGSSVSEAELFATVRCHLSLLSESAHNETNSRINQNTWIIMKI